MVKEPKSKTTKKKTAKKKVTPRPVEKEIEQSQEVEEDKMCSEEIETEKNMSEADPETLEEMEELAEERDPKEAALEIIDDLMSATQKEAYLISVFSSYKKTEKDLTDEEWEEIGDNAKKYIEEKEGCIPVFTLVRIPQGVFLDIYGRPEVIATRMAWVNKESFHVIQNVIDSEYNGRIIITDIYRKPSESHLARRKKGPMVAPCGLSGHNYGISIDIDVKGTAKSFGMRASEMREEMSKLGFHSISTEDWHYNMGFNPSKSFFYGLYEKCSEEFLNHVEEVFVEKFNAVCSLDMKNLGSIQALLDIKADSIFGKKTFLSASMLMAEKAGMLDVMNSEKEELVVDFGLLWN